MKIKDLGGGKLQVPVTTLVRMRRWFGFRSAHVAAAITTSFAGDPETVAQFKLDQVPSAICSAVDHDNRYGRDYRKGAFSVAWWCTATATGRAWGRRDHVDDLRHKR